MMIYCFSCLKNYNQETKETFSLTKRQIPICRGDKHFCHGFYDPWLFLCLQQVSIWFSWVQILFLAQWVYFEKIFFQRFAGSIPIGEGMDLFWKELFVNNLCLTQKTGRIWNPVVGSSPSGRLRSVFSSWKIAFSVVRILRLEEKSKMDLWKFEKS